MMKRPASTMSTAWIAFAFAATTALVPACSSPNSPTDSGGADGDASATDGTLGDSTLDTTPAGDADAAAPIDVASDSQTTDATVMQDATDVGDSATGPCLSGFSGTMLDINSLSGLYVGADATVAQAANNVTVINMAAEMMRMAGGALYSSQGGIVMIGAPASGPSGHLIHSGLDNGTQHGLNHWCLGNVTFRLMPNQPMFAEGTSPSAMIYVSNATAPEFEFTLDGNAANQYQIDLNRPMTATSNRAGFFGTGLDLYQSGPTQFAVTVYNIRSVTGSTGPTLLHQPNMPTQTAMVDCGECFHMQQRRGLGGDTGWIHSETNDGSDPGSATTTDTRASGPVWHFVQEPGGRGTSPVSAVLFTSINVRHGVGTYCGGRLQILNGSLFDGCEHDINLEAGIPLHADNYETASVTIGEMGAPPGSVITRNASRIGIQENNNSSSDTTMFPYTHNFGVGRVDVYGWDSTNDEHAIDIDGTSTAGPFNVHAGIVHSPRTVCVNFAPASNDAQFNLIGLCRVHLGTAILYSPTTAMAASGTWDTTL